LPVVVGVVGVAVVVVGGLAVGGVLGVEGVVVAESEQFGCEWRHVGELWVVEDVLGGVVEVAGGHAR